MARGDSKNSRRRWGGGGTYRHYDDEGRGNSKYYWAEFKSWFEESGYSQDWLMGENTEGIDPTIARLFTAGNLNRLFARQDKSLLAHGLYDGRLFAYIQSMRSRYNVHDWAYQKFEDTDSNDGRVRRLVVQKLGLDVWHKFQERAHKVWMYIDDQRKEAQAERAGKDAEDRATFAAERIERQSKEVVQIKKGTALIAGAIRSDFDAAFSIEEIYGRSSGDWLDDPVAGATSGYGFGEEVRKPSGIQLQITVSLDMSNSMYYNDLHESAGEAYRDIYLALEQIKSEHADDLHIAAFTFANDGYEDKDRGRVARNLSVEYEYARDEDGRYIRDEVNGGYKQIAKINKSSETELGAVEAFRAGGSSYHFSGEDTWFYPLFEEIEKWETIHSEPGAVRLDIVITDAVIEHPSDIRRSDVIQGRRDGNLQTVMLNLLPEDEWVNSDLPLNCVQYAITPENLAGVLRNLLTEFVSVYL
jgi:cation transport regulator ChaB